MENVYDKKVISSPYGGEIAASQMTVKISNNNNSQKITVPTMQKQRVASPPSLTLEESLKRLRYRSKYGWNFSTSCYISGNILCFKIWQHLSQSANEIFDTAVLNKTKPTSITTSETKLPEQTMHCAHNNVFVFSIDHVHWTNSSKAEDRPTQWIFLKSLIKSFI